MPGGNSYDLDMGTPGQVGKGKGGRYKASREVEREKKQVDLPRGQSTLPGASNTSGVNCRVC